MVLKTENISRRPSRPEPRHIVRWYVLRFPSRVRSVEAEMEQERAYRERNGDASFDYFAPTFLEVKEVNGKLVSTRKSLLYNYIFIHASEAEIFRMKERLPHYNLLSRVIDGEKTYHYPYLTDEAMRILQWIARSYEGSIPLYSIDPRLLIIGDRIRILEGPFKGIEACIVTRPRSRKKGVMVCIDQWMWIPLLQIRAGQYEVIELSDHSTAVKYARLNNERLQNQLHEALCRHQRGETTDEDRAMASDTVLRYANITVETKLLRSKLYGLLLMAYTILDRDEDKESVLQLSQLLLSSLTAEQARVQLLIALYGCTDSSIYYEQVHAAVAPWGAAEEVARKSRAELLRRLEEYDRILGHDGKS